MPDHSIIESICPVMEEKGQIRAKTTNQTARRRTIKYEEEKSKKRWRDAAEWTSKSYFALAEAPLLANDVCGT